MHWKTRAKAKMALGNLEDIKFDLRRIVRAKRRTRVCRSDVD